MSNSKIEFRIGEIEFSGEGNEKWLSEQLDKVIANVPELLKVKPVAKPKPATNSSTTKQNTQQPISTTLAGYLKEKSATTNQSKKFLATAVYLHKSGKNRLSTSDITNALKDARQAKLTNASQCLNSQVTKGFAEKDGSQFYVTPEGEASL